MLYKHRITGMTCTHCSKAVTDLLEPLKLNNLVVSHHTGLITYENPESCYSSIESLIKTSDYGLKAYKKPFWNYLSYLLIILTFILLTRTVYNNFGLIKLNSSTAYVSIFIFGLVTSLHCVGMCGGIALSQTNFVTPKKNILNTLQYNIGRILTYSVMGGLLGLLGSQITISDDFRSIMFFVIGAIMLLIGFNNLGLIQFNFIKIGFKKTKFKSNVPLLVGVLNGFMPCAPLQTMQLLALTSSSFFSGFMVMMLFGIGTMPLLFIFSNLGLFIKKSHHIHIKRVSAIIVIMMSVMIFQQGFNTLGITLDQTEDESMPFAQIVDGYQIVNIEVDPYYTTEAVQVVKDVPVKLLITVKSISGCTANIMVPKYDVNTDLKVGEVHELIFTPTVSENLKITCWMSMVNTFLQVVE